MFAWLSNLLKRTPAEHWKLVKTHTIEVVKRGSQDKGKIYYHLFESDRGNRKVEYACTISEIQNSPATLVQSAERFDDYHEMIFPWVRGRYDPDIPSYADVDLEDVQKKLSQ